MKDRRCLSQVWVYVYWGCWLDACPPGWLPSGGMGSHVVWPGSGVPVLCAKARKMSAEEQRNRRRYGGAERERERERERTKLGGDGDRFGDYVFCIAPIWVVQSIYKHKIHQTCTVAPAPAYEVHGCKVNPHVWSIFGRSRPKWTFY